MISLVPDRCELLTVRIGSNGGEKVIAGVYKFQNCLLDFVSKGLSVIE